MKRKSAHDHKLKLTDRTLRALKPTDKLHDIWDTVLPGFGVRIAPSGRRTFILVARYGGKGSNPTRRALGDYPTFGLADAREKAAEWRRLIAKGKDPGIEEERERRDLEKRRANTFAVVAEDFIEQKLPAERKAKVVESDLRREFIPQLGEMAVGEITAADLLPIIRSKARTAKAQARNLLGHVKRLFQWAVDQQCYTGLNTSPLLATRPSAILGDKKHGTRILTDDELFALWRAAGRIGYPYGPVYRLLALTGLRLNECADASRSELDPAVVRALRQRKKGAPINWADMPLERQIWTVPPERMKGKNGKTRAHVVPLTSELLSIIEELPDSKGDFLFSSTGGMKPVWIGSQVKKRIDSRMLRTLRALAKRRDDDVGKVELRPWVNHDLRRTVRSRLSSLRIPHEVCEAVLAHSQKDLDKVYNHDTFLDQKRDALSLWAAKLLSIVEPPVVTPSNATSIGEAARVNS